MSNEMEQALFWLCVINSFWIGQIGMAAVVWLYRNLDSNKETKEVNDER